MIDQIKKMDIADLVVELFNSSILISAIIVFSHIGNWMSYLFAILLYGAIQMVLAACKVTSIVQIMIVALFAFVMLLAVIGFVTSGIELLFYIIALILGFFLSIYFKLRKFNL